MATVPVTLLNVVSTAAAGITRQVAPGNITGLAPMLFTEKTAGKRPCILRINRQSKVGNIAVYGMDVCNRNVGGPAPGVTQVAWSWRTRVTTAATVFDTDIPWVAHAPTTAGGGAYLVTSNGLIAAITGTTPAPLASDGLPAAGSGQYLTQTVAVSNNGGFLRLTFSANQAVGAEIVAYRSAVVEILAAGTHANEATQVNGVSALWVHTAGIETADQWVGLEALGC